MRTKKIHALLSLAVSAAWLGCLNFSSVSDKTRSDAGAGSDTGGGGPPADSSTPSGSVCASVSPDTGFCDDFDEYETASLTSWDQVEANNGTVSVDSITPAHSPPSSMTAQTSAAQSGVDTNADVIKQLSPLVGSGGFALQISFWMNIRQWDTSSSGQILAFELIFAQTPTSFHQVVMNLNSLGPGGVTAQMAENAQVDGGQGGYTPFPFASHPLTKTWTKVEINLNVPDRSGSNGNTVSVSLDGKAQVNTQALMVPIGGGTPALHLGIGYVATPATPWVVNFDDFVVNVTKF